MSNYYHKKNFSQDEPRCVVCSTSFYFRDLTNPFGHKCPLVLQCGHSACEGCLTSALSKFGVLVCPICNFISEPQKNIDVKNLKRSELLLLRDEFPLNVYAVGQVSLKRNNSSKIADGFIKFFPKNKMAGDGITVHCNECNEQNADCSCRQCETELCSSCFLHIHNSVTLRKHEKITLKEKQAYELFEGNTCKSHKGLFLNIFCKDCEIYICKECIIEENHLAHRCTDVYQQNEDKLPEFSDLFDEANGVLKQLYSTKKKLQQSTKGRVFDEEAQKVERQVQVHYSYLHGMLQRQEEEAIKKIRAVSQMAKTSLETVLVDLEKNINEIEQLLSIVSSTVTSSKIREIPLESVLEKLRNITGTPCHVVLNNEENSKFELHIDPKITEVLAGHCSVNVPLQRTFELRSKDELPETYKVESIENISDPFKKPELSLLKITNKNKGAIEVQNTLLNAITGTNSQPQTEAKTKPQDLRRKTQFQSRDRTHSASSQSMMSVLSSASSQESSVEKIIKVKPLAKGSTELVQMIHVTSPNNFYVQRKCSLVDIEKLWEYFSKNANRSKNPPSEIENGQTYLVHYSRDKNWYRGRVTRVDGNYCDIFYVDYGNSETRVPKNKLRDISDRYAEIPGQALHCGLDNCTPMNGEWSLEANKLLLNMANGKDLTMYVERINEKNGFHEVHLKTADGSTGSFTDALIYSGYACRTESTIREEGLFKSSLSAKKNGFKISVIKDHEDFDGQVTHINTPTNFYVQKIADGGELMMNLMRDLSETYSRYGENEGLVFTPTVGMSVAARFKNDGGWYRATVLGITEPRKVQVKYVDFGNVDVVDIKCIRELQPKFLRVAAQALKCSLNDIAPKHPRGWAASAKIAFEKLVLNKGLLRVYVEKVKEDNFLSIVLYETLPTKFINISGMLVKKGHALSTGQTSAQAEFACRPDYDVKQRHSNKTMSDSESVYSEFSETSGLSRSGIKNQANMNGSIPRGGSPIVNGDRRTEQNAGSMLQSRDALDENIDGRVKVELLKIISPSEIYVTSGITSKLIKRLVKEMTAFYDKQEGEEREWSAGNLCAVLRSKDNQWYRGVITEMSHTNFKVFIKDIVEVLDVDTTKLHPLEDKFYDTRDGSTKVHLGGLKVPAGLKAWPASTTDYLHRLTEESESLYIEKLESASRDSIPVRMWRRTQKQAGPLEPLRDEWCDINESLITMGFALPDHDEIILSSNIQPNDKYVMSWLDNSFQPIHEHQETENSVKISSEAPYFSDLEKAETMSVKTTRSTRTSRSNRGRTPSQRACYIPTFIGPDSPEMITEWKPAAPFKKNSFVGLPTYVDYDCSIFIQDIDSCESTLDLLEKAFLSLYEHSEKRPHEEEYLEGQICIAFFATTQKWYRGKVLKVKPQHIEVLFVDYGNVEELQPNELRKQVTMGHIPIQCHKCRTDGIIPISHNGKWTIQALDFIHSAVVEKRCETVLKPVDDSCEEYIILSLKLPGGEDLLETLLSMHYATYMLDCEQVSEEAEEEVIIEDQDIQLAFSNSETSKRLVEEIKTLSANLEAMNANSKALEPENKEVDDEELIEDHVKSLQQAKPHFDWYEATKMELEKMAEVQPFISELDSTPRTELRFKDLYLPDSMVEFTVEVQTICSFNSLKVTIVDSEDDEVTKFLDQLHSLFGVIQEEAFNLPMLTQPVKGLVCLGCYSNDNTWYRAVIRNVLPNGMVKVYYVDYGNEEDIPIERCREIKPDWTVMPVQAFQVKLHKVWEGPNYNPKLCHEAYMNCLMEPPYTLVIESRFPQLEVELYNSKGEFAYKPLLDVGLIFKESS